VKLERNGMVAVLYSPGYGAGWSTWADEGQAEFVLFDSEVVQAVLDKDLDRAKTIVSNKYPNFYMGGLSDLVVGWVPKGQAFEITEYDGSESLRIIGETSFLIA